MSEKGFSHIKKEVFDYEPVTRQGFQLPLPAEVCVSIDHHDDLYVSLQYCGWLFHRTVRGQHGAFRRQYRLSCRQHSSCRRHHVRYRRQRRRRCKDRTGKTGGSQPQLFGPYPYHTDHRYSGRSARQPVLPSDLQSARCNAGADGLRYRLSADDPFLCPGLSSPGAIPVLLCNSRAPGTRTFPYGVRRHYQHASGLSVCRSAPSWCCRSCPCHRPWPVHSGRCRHFILYLCPQRPSLHPSGIFQRPALHKLLQRFLRDGQQSFCSRCHLPFQHADAEI